MRTIDAVVIRVTHGGGMVSARHVWWQTWSQAVDLDIIEVAETFHEVNTRGEPICPASDRLGGQASFQVIRRSVAEKVARPCKTCAGY